MHDEVPVELTVWDTSSICKNSSISDTACTGVRRQGSADHEVVSVSPTVMTLLCAWRLLTM